MRTITDSFIGPRYRVYATVPESTSRTRRLISIVSALSIPVIWFMTLPETAETAGTVVMDTDARVTLVVFAVAVWMWVFSAVSDTFVALSAASVLVLLGIISADALFSPLGSETIWLLIGAFIISSAVTRSGLALRVTVRISVGISSPRILVHVLTFATVLTAFVVPATSGRAALILPVFLAFSAVLPAWLLRVLAITLPSVVLFSAVASLIGAGAHLITEQILLDQGLEGFSFTRWLLLGLPFALFSSHLAAEIILLALSDDKQRAQQLVITEKALNRGKAQEPIGAKELRSLLVLGGVVILWFTESIHHIPPAMVAVLGALLAASPYIGTVDLAEAVRKIPWSLLLFMAATIAISQALTESGAVEILASSLLQGLNGTMFVLVVIVVSAAAHLVIQSRSARSAVLIPIVVALAPAVGVNPVAAAFISTAAAGFCHTLPASAKPLAIFRGDDTGAKQNFDPSDLARMSLLMAPMFIAVTAVFAFCIWPALGLPLFN